MGAGQHGEPCQPTREERAARRSIQSQQREAWRLGRPDLTFLVGQEAPETEDLSHEDANGDEELRDHPEGSPQVFGGQLPQVHRDNVGRQTWQGIEAKTPSGNIKSGRNKLCLQTLSTLIQPSQQLGGNFRLQTARISQPLF